MEPGCQQWQCSVSLSFLKLKQAFYVTWGWGIHVRVDAIWMRISQQLWKGNSLRNHYKLLFLLCLFFFFQFLEKLASFMKPFCSISFEVAFFHALHTQQPQLHMCEIDGYSLQNAFNAVFFKKDLKKSLRLICCFYLGWFFLSERLFFYPQSKF